MSVSKAEIIHRCDACWFELNIASSSQSIQAGWVIISIGGEPNTLDVCHDCVGEIGLGEIIKFIKGRLPVEAPNE